MMRKVVSGAVFVGIALTPGCGLRYEVVKPPQPERKMVSVPLKFQKEKPLFEQVQLSLPKVLRCCKLDIRFKTLDRE